MRARETEEAMRRVIMTVVNSREFAGFLDKIPYLPVAEDLIAVPQIMGPNGGHIAVANKDAAEMQMTPEEVLQLAKENTVSNTRVESMDNMLGISPGEIGQKMVVLTNRQSYYGAGTILNDKAMADVKRELGNFMILPSSVHEVIAVRLPEDGAGAGPEKYREMVRSINRFELSPGDVLSDNIYRFDGKKISMIGDTFRPEVPRMERAPEIAFSGPKMAM